MKSYDIMSVSEESTLACSRGLLPGRLSEAREFPAKLGALAYTQGTQMYIGPGQERHLEHELGHVLQQKRGIVKADGHLNGLLVNRDPGLERAADLGPDQPIQAFGGRMGAAPIQIPQGVSL